MKNGWRHHSKKPNVATVWTCHPVCSTCVYSGHFSSAVSVFFVSFPLLPVSWTNLVDDSGKKSDPVSPPTLFGTQSFNKMISRDTLLSVARSLFCSALLNCVSSGVVMNENLSLKSTGSPFKWRAKQKNWENTTLSLLFLSTAKFVIKCPAPLLFSNLVGRAAINRNTGVREISWTRPKVQQVLPRKKEPFKVALEWVKRLGMSRWEPLCYTATPPPTPFFSLGVVHLASFTFVFSWRRGQLEKAGLFESCRRRGRGGPEGRNPHAHTYQPKM